MDIICHIVGLSDILGDKHRFNETINKKYTKLAIIDLDKLSSQIKKDPVMKKLEIKYETYKDKNKDYKYVQLKMYKYWQTVMQDKLDKEINKHKNKKIVILGLSTFYTNYNIFIKVYTTNKFFIKSNDLSNAKKTIEYNINNYKNQIINGKFPLKHLSLDHLIKKKESMLRFYIDKYDYELKTPYAVNNFIYKIMDQYESIQNVPKLYVGSLNKYDKYINLNKVIAYTEDWLALISSIPNINRKIRKGFNKNKPFIQELHNNSFNALNTNCYIYQVEKSTFIFDKNKFRLISEEPVKIIKRTYIANIYKKLKSKNIQFISKKSAE